MEQERILISTHNNQIEKLDNNRTVIHVGDIKSSVSDIINRFNTLNIWDGQYTFTNDIPPILIYYLRLPFETLMDAVRIQSDSESNLLKIFIEQQEENDKLIIRSTSRICRLPKDYKYNYNNLRINFLQDNFIRIEIPTLN